MRESVREREKEGDQENPSILCEIHVDGSGHDAVIPGIAPIAPVIRRPAADIFDHASEEMDLPPFISAAATIRRNTPTPAPAPAPDSGVGVGIGAAGAVT